MTLVITPEDVRSQAQQRLRSLQQKLPLDFPLALDIESTNLCNLECFFCPRKEAAKGEGLMEMDLFTRIVDECAERGPLSKIGLHKDGEPLAHPKIVDMVRYIRDRAAAKVVSFTSNGILMKPKRAQELIAAGLNDVSFSIDAVREDTYYESKGRRKYAVVEDNIRNFLAVRTDDIRVTVKFIRMKENDGQEEEFVEKWRESGADEILITQYHDWSGSVRDSSLVEIAGGNAFACENPWYAMAVNWDGKVSICCVDWDSQAVVGDANVESIGAIWQGDKMREVRSLHLRGDADCVTPCATCTYKDPQIRRVVGSWLMENERTLATAS